VPAAGRDASVGLFRSDAAARSRKSIFGMHINRRHSAQTGLGLRLNQEHRLVEGRSLGRH
jgi:hypothetical protein